MQLITNLICQLIQDSSFHSDDLVISGGEGGIHQAISHYKMVKGVRMHMSIALDELIVVNSW